MSERHFYGSDNKYMGSMDDDGRFYDTRHRFIGRVKNGTIYDDCNIPRGHIDSEGRVTDMCNIPTGKEFGANFVGWGGHGSGYVRNDILSTGHGNDYGAFQQLYRHKHNSVSYDDDNHGDDNYGNDDDDYGEEDDGSDWDDSFTPEPAPRRRRRRNDSGNAQSDLEEGIGGCIDGIGGCVGVIFGLIILYQVIKHFAS